MPTQHAPGAPIQIPLTSSPSQRQVDTTQDSKLINGFIEKLPSGNVVVVKRPGFLRSQPIGGTSALGIGTGLGSVWSVVDTILYQDGGNITAVGSLDSTSIYSFAASEMVVSGQTAMFFHNNSHAYYYVGGAGPGLVAISALGVANYPQGLCYGSAFLDGTMYVLAYPNMILGSNINDLSTWNAGNVIKAQMHPDRGVAIFRQLNYIVVLKETTTEAFFDAGNPTGSPLQSAPNMFIPYGCFSPRTLQVMGETAAWVFESLIGGRGVMVLENMRARVVSTPAISRMLEDYTLPPTNSFSIKVAGHLFYGFNLQAAGVTHTMVYDLTTDHWSEWTDGSGNALVYNGSGTNNLGTTLQAANGDNYFVNVAQGNDTVGGPYPLEVTTPVWDGGSQQKKYAHRLDVIADQKGTWKGLISVSDDDYQTWSNWRSVDLWRDKKALYNCGTFRRRAWKFRYLSPNPMRLKALELTVMPGHG